MFRRFFVNTFRNAIRNKVTTSINVIGLSVSFTALILLGLVIYNELSHDSFHDDVENIYSISMDGGKSAWTPAIIKDIITSKIPEVNQVVRMQLWELNNKALRYKENPPLNINNIIRADSNFFEVFNFSFIYGNKKTALTDPFSIVLTRTTSEKLFGNEDPMGQILSFNKNQVLLKVTGVINDVPPNSSMIFNAVLSTEVVKTINPYSLLIDGLEAFNFETFIKINPDCSPEMVESKMTEIVKESLPGKWQERIKNGSKLIQYRSVYFKNEYISSLQHGNRTNVYILSAICLIILIIASINFINLSISGASLRRKEIYVKKIMGINRMGLVIQFLGEAVFLSLISIIFAFILSKITIVLAGSAIDMFSKIVFPDFVTTVLIILCGSILTGTISGAYPAFYLSSLLPVSDLKITNAGGYKKLSIREVLVIIQFISSMILIICAVGISKQYKFATRADLGLVKENVISFRINPSIERNKKAFMDELLKSSYIRKIGFASSDLFNNRRREVPVQVLNQGNLITVNVSSIAVDSNFIELLGIKIKKGESFSHLKKDSAVFIMNETAGKSIGIENKIEDVVIVDTVKKVRWKAIGITEDFHYRSLHDPIGPFVFYFSCNWLNMAHIKLNALNGDQLEEAKLFITKVWSEFSPDSPIEISYLKQSIDTQYDSDKDYLVLHTFFALFAIFISCLGLFGLTTYTVLQREKEIGIRKVQGAYGNDILLLLLSDFLRSVWIAFLIAVPLAWYIMQNWLKNFAFKIDLKVWIFVLSGFLCLIIALVTIIGKVYNASKRNPVDALKQD